MNLGISKELIEILFMLKEFFIKTFWWSDYSEKIKKKN